jgi:hypothetical protein
MFVPQMAAIRWVSSYTIKYEIGTSIGTEQNNLYQCSGSAISLELAPAECDFPHRKSCFALRSRKDTEHHVAYGTVLPRRTMFWEQSTKGDKHILRVPKNLQVFSDLPKVKTEV